ncbi:hypothetical protein BDZ89DRAFT_1222295 [Hymenopellis radicata]|nr:hypothetical protein BDZ89DRAFT_1222295 [Hymenopellis radicata]
MIPHLEDHLISARESLKESIEHFLGLSVTRGRDNVEKWEKMSTLPVKVGNEWRSVYRVSTRKLPSREAVYLDLLKTEKAHDDAEALAMKTQNQETQFLNAGLKLQERQHQLKRAQKAASTETELGVVRRSRAALLGDIRRWRKEQIQLVPMLSKLASSEDGNENDQILVETEKLYLPSDFSPAERSQLGLVTLAEVELKLREGEANDAVVFLCEAITHVMMFRSVKEKHARGVSQNTRAAKFIRGVNDRRNAYADQYRRARKAVLALKAINESSDYPILTQEDMYAKNAVNARELGDGSKTDGWIWRYGNLKGLNQEQRKEFVRETEQVQWFRAKADMDRWMEEVETLEEEFRRYIRGCQSMSSYWTDMSANQWGPYTFSRCIGNFDATSGYRVYAAQKADMYQEIADHAEKRFSATKVGGAWPGEKDDLNNFVRSRRPRLTVDWDVDKQAFEDV